MMTFTDKELRGLPVYTESGDRLGKVAGFVIDPGTHGVVQYVVSRSRVLSSILPKELLVHFSQVVSLDNEKMVVKGDLVKAEQELSKAVRETAAGIMTSVSKCNQE